MSIVLFLSGCSLNDVMEKASQKTYQAMKDKEDTGRRVIDDSPLKDGTITRAESGSGVIDELRVGNNSSNHIDVYSTAGDLLETEISVIDATNEEDSSDEILASSLDNVDTNKGVNNFCYAYSMLNDSEKLAYREIFSILDDLLEDVILTSKDVDEIDKAFKSVMVDHPEIFYVKGYSIGKYMYGDTIDRISLSGTYTLSKQEVADKKREIENYITRVIDNAPLRDDYSKIKYVYEYLVHNNVYLESSVNNQNILSVVENGETVCQGYAKMTQLLLNRMGIFCTLVNGEACGNNGVNTGKTLSNEWGAHVWNIVKCDGDYYNVDTTWGDAAFTLIDPDSSDAPVIDINYEFLLVDDAALKGTHRPKPVVDMPKCNSLLANYYVKEGAYFENVNEEQLRNIFDRAYMTGQSPVYLKASNDMVYEELVDYLIREQGIFDYISQSNVKYVEYAERRMMLVSL